MSAGPKFVLTVRLVKPRWGGNCMLIGASRTGLLSQRNCRALALIIFLLRAGLPLWAQDKEWSKHMNAGSKASMSFNYEKAEKEFQAALALTQTFPPNDLRTGGDAEHTCDALRGRREICRRGNPTNAGGHHFRSLRGA